MKGVRSEFREKLISQLFELARAEAQKQKRVVVHTNHYYLLHQSSIFEFYELGNRTV